MSYFQGSDGKLGSTVCSPKLGCASFHRNRKIFWAWDRSLGAWVHYTA